MNRSARDERERPISRASFSTDQGSPGLLCSNVSARPTERSRNPASQPVCSLGIESRCRRTASTHELAQACQAVGVEVYLNLDPRAKKTARSVNRAARGIPISSLAPLCAGLVRPNQEKT